MHIELIAYSKIKKNLSFKYNTCTVYNNINIHTTCHPKIISFRSKTSRTNFILFAKRLEQFAIKPRIMLQVPKPFKS